MATWPTKWKHQPTILRRQPETFVRELEAIAHWADEQENPTAVLESLLGMGAIALWVQKQEDPNAAIQSVLETIEPSRE